MIDPIEARFGALISALAPAARTLLAREIAHGLRLSQSKRIAAQQNPDGRAFEPRKPQLRNRKKNLRAGMFSKLRTTKYLKASATADTAIVSFTRDVQRIARVHQLGLRDRVSRTGREADYPARQLLGISKTDELAITHLVTTHLAKAL